MTHVKLFADGALGSRGAALSHPYADDPAFEGWLFETCRREKVDGVLSGVEAVLERLAAGQRADFTLWDVPGPEFLVYQSGGVKPVATYIEGRPA